MDDSVEILKEMLVWMRAGSFDSVKKAFLDELGSETSKPEQRLAYELLDGARSQKDVIALCRRAIPGCKISPATLSRWVGGWERRGWVERSGMVSRRLFSLGDFGIEVPELPS